MLRLAAPLSRGGRGRFSSAENLQALLLPRIVSRIDVRDALRPHPMQLKSGLFGKPRIVRHAFRDKGIAADLDQRAFLFVELVARADVEASRKDRHVLIVGWV